MNYLTVEWCDYISSKISSINGLKSLDHDSYLNLPKLDITSIDIIKSIPMMMRRKLNPAGRMAVALSLKAFSETNSPESIGKIVYASRVGETLRCINLIHEIISGTDSSPAEFSSSVHNGNVGIFSIIKKFHGDTSAIAAGVNTLYCALLDAKASLVSAKLEKVLLVVYDENIVAEHIKLFNDYSVTDEPNALALVVSLKKDTGFEINIDDTKNLNTLSFALNLANKKAL